MWIDLRNFDEKEIRNTVVVGDYSVRQETKAEAQAKQKPKQKQKPQAADLAAAAARSRIQF
jgi:hypothetical protein